ncbi:MAG: hypothetical protein AABZ74_13970 [Cyanobacteriota bacterium]
MKGKLLSIILIGFLFIWYYGVLKARIDNDPSRKPIKKTVNINNKDRNLFISTSSNKLKDRNAPLIIFLHGMDGAWPNKKNTKPQYEYINQLAFKKDFIAVFPQGSIGKCGDSSEKYYFYYCWDKTGKTDFDFIKKLRTTLITQYGVSSEKTYLIGFSDGAYFVSKYLNSNNYKDFSGYGINSAGVEIEKFDSNTKLSLTVGKKDTFEFDGSKKTKENLLKMGYTDNNFQYLEHDGGHNISRIALEKQIDFLLKK